MYTCTKETDFWSELDLTEETKIHGNPKIYCFIVKHFIALFDMINVFLSKKYTSLYLDLNNTFYFCMILVVVIFVQVYNSIFSNTLRSELNIHIIN